MPQADFTVTESDGLTIFQIGGELDIANTPEIGAAIRLQIEKSPKAIVVSIADVSYFDSSAANALFKCKALADKLRVRFLLVLPQRSSAQRIAGFLGFPAVFEIVDSVDQATAATR